MQSTWSLLRNATAAVGSLKVSDGGRGHSGGEDAALKQTSMLGGGRPSTQDSLGGASPPGAISRSGSLQQGLQRSGSLLLRQHSASASPRPGLLMTTPSDVAAWDLPSPHSLAGSLSPRTPQGSTGPAAASAVDSYNALKQSLSRLEQQNRQLSQRNGELEAALEERSRKWQQVGLRAGSHVCSHSGCCHRCHHGRVHERPSTCCLLWAQERLQLEQVVQSQAAQLDLMRQQQAAAARGQEAASMEAGQCKAGLQAAQQQLAAAQALANQRGQEVCGWRSPPAALPCCGAASCLLGVCEVLPVHSMCRTTSLLARHPGARAEPDAQGVGRDAAEPGCADRDVDQPRRVQDHHAPVMNEPAAGTS